MKKLFVWMALIFGGIVMLFSAGPEMLAGQIMGLQPGSATHIIRGCLSGRCGFEVWQYGNYQLYLGPIANGYGWVMSSMGTNEKVALDVIKHGGNFSDGKTVSEFVAYLKETGWTKAPLREGGMGIRATILGLYSSLALYFRKRSKEKIEDMGG